jgi:hypothetical protein
LLRPVKAYEAARAGDVDDHGTPYWWGWLGDAAVQPQLEFPDTGDIEADLIAQVRSFVGLLAGRPGSVMRELIGHAQTDPELLTAFRERYSRPRCDLAITATRRARERGQIRADVDLEVIVDQLWGAGYHRLLLPDEPLTEQFATALVRNIMTGVAASR